MKERSFLRKFYQLILKKSTLSLTAYNYYYELTVQLLLVSEYTA